MATVTQRVARRPRAYVRVQGPEAVSYLNRMLTNDVPADGAVDAVLLTAKARVVAPVLVWRRGEDDVLLLTEPELGEPLRDQLVRMRFAARCEIALEEHHSVIVLGGGDGITNRDYGVPAVEVLDADVPGAPADAVELERLRILARTPRFGVDVDESVFPGEAGLDERAVSWSKGCYPGQEFVARLRYRGHPNKRLRLLEVEGRPRRDQEICFDGAEVGRVTSAVDGLALGYVRATVPDDAALEVGGLPARLAG